MSAREIIAAVAAVLVAAFLVWRWRRLSFERKALGVVIALALGVYASGVLSELPDPTPWLQGAELLLTSGMWLTEEQDRAARADAWARRRSFCWGACSWERAPLSTRCIGN